MVIPSAAHTDISAGIISHEIMSALSDCILYGVTGGPACLFHSHAEKKRVLHPEEEEEAAVKEEAFRSSEVLK